MNVRRLFLDIETSPCTGYFWRPGYNLTIDYNNIIKERQIICACWKWENEDFIYSIDWGEEQNDKRVLEVLVPEIQNADQIVAHNGDRFDVKWIRGRCLVHKIPFPYKLNTFDTCTELRKLCNLNSYRLDYISKLLGYPGKTDTGGFDLWKRVMNGDKKSLKQMVAYCEGDVLRLEEIYQDIESFSSPKLHVGVMNGQPRWTCPVCGSDKVSSNGPTTTATGIVKWRMRCNLCNSYYRIPSTIRELMLRDQ